jgi:glycosyltransferase involved in cell wall biosynthesis
MMESGPLSLVCPAHNEADNISNLLSEWHAAFVQLGTTFEIIVVDDGSTDGTVGEVRRMQRELDGIRLLRRPGRGGQSRALLSGFAHARGQIIITCDADLQNDPSDLPELLGRLEECDLVCGWRRDRRDSRRRCLFSAAANSILQRLFQHQLHDVGCALRVFRREVADALPPFDGLHRFFAMVALIEGFRVIEIPVHHRARRKGVSKYGLFDRLFRTIRDLFGLHWYRSRRIARTELTTATEWSLTQSHVESDAHDERDWPDAIPIRPRPGSEEGPMRKSA